LIAGDPREALDFVARAGFRYVQLSAAVPAMRPRELDRSARRDLLARLRRIELTPAGLDLWIPEEHLLDAAQMDRAVAAMVDAVELAADLGRIPLSIRLPEKTEPRHVAHLAQRAETCSVPLAQHGPAFPELPRGIDPAESILAGLDPALEAARAPLLAAARFSDADRVGGAGRVTPGSGKLDILEYQVALLSRGFARPVTLDLRALPQPRRIAVSCRDEWESTGILQSPAS